MARDHFLRIGNVGRRDLVHHLGGGVTQHPLGADVEDLDHALGVGGDAREVGAVENRTLQGPRFQQGLRVWDIYDIRPFSRVLVDSRHSSRLFSLLRESPAFDYSEIQCRSIENSACRGSMPRARPDSMASILPELELHVISAVRVPAGPA